MLLPDLPRILNLPISRYPLAKAASTIEVRVAASLSLYVPTVDEKSNIIILCTAIVRASVVNSQ